MKNVRDRSDSVPDILKRKGGNYESIDVKWKRKKRGKYIPVSSGSGKRAGKTGHRV